MAWFDPKIDWASNEEMSASAWNEIIYDAEYILDAIGETVRADVVIGYLIPSGQTILFLPLEWWDTLRRYLYDANVTLGVSDIEVPTDDMTAEQLNRMERLLWLAWLKIGQIGARLYTNDPIYTGDPDIYAR